MEHQCNNYNHKMRLVLFLHKVTQSSILLNYQVYAPRIDDPRSRTFESCSTDTFQISGPCTYQVCYVYLYRSGYDGWKVDTVTIYGHYTRAVTFYYNAFIPNNLWFGFDLCHGTSASSTSIMQQDMDVQTSELLFSAYLGLSGLQWYLESINKMSIVAGPDLHHTFVILKLKNQAHSSRARSISYVPFNVYHT